MSDLSLSRGGYANRRSPGALAAAVALNGGVVALLITIPAAKVIIEQAPRLVTYEVTPAPPPPPNVDKPKPEKQRNPIQKAVETPVRPSDPVIPDIMVSTGGSAIDRGAFVDLPPIGDVGLQKETPHTPVLTAAKPDPRFADAFHPDYPPSLRRDGLEGSVTVRVTIDERGRVIAVEMVRATNTAFFEETRRQALKEWRFTPATRDGVPICTEQTMTVSFRLED